MTNELDLRLTWRAARRGPCASKDGAYLIRLVVLEQTLWRGTKVGWQVYFNGVAVGLAEERLVDAKNAAAHHAVNRYYGLHKMGVA